MLAEIAVVTEGLTRVFGSIRAIDALSLKVERGAIFGLLGPNGSGKTTTVRLLLGLLRATSGRASVLGFQVGADSAEIRRRTGVLLDTDGLYDKLTAMGNLRFFGDVYHLPADERERRTQELLEMAGLWDRRNEQVEKWSRGMRQKLAIIRAVMHAPELVIMDEPTTGLDPVSIKMVRDLIVSLAQTQKHTIFLCTHNLDEAERICSEVAVIKQGRLLLQEAPSHLRERMSIPQIRITVVGLSEQALQQVRAVPFVQAVTVNDSVLTVTVSDASRPEDLVRTLVLAGVGVQEVHKPTKSLEDVYLELVGPEQAA
jgi:ABC-2 type transport system ATP-binding protein